LANCCRGWPESGALAVLHAGWGPVGLFNQQTAICFSTVTLEASDAAIEPFPTEQLELCFHHNPYGMNAKKRKQKGIGLYFLLIFP
jgi:hypothetical protein